jgi:hypothetical protein
MIWTTNQDMSVLAADGRRRQTASSDVQWTGKPLVTAARPFQSGARLNLLADLVLRRNL